MQPILEYTLFSLGNYHFTVAMLAGLLLIWLLTVLLLRAIRRVLQKGDSRLIDLSDKGRRMSIYLLAKYCIWTLASVAMLEVVGFQISVLLAGSAALLVGLGLGVQQIFRDIVSGVFLLFEGTIEIGDILEVDGKVGKVSEINLRTSKILTRDGHVMIVPNSRFITENVLNWTHHESHPSAFKVSVLVGHAADEQKVSAIIQNAAAKHPEVLKAPAEHAPKARLVDFQEKGTLYELRFWSQNKFDIEQVQSELRFAIQQALREQNIPRPKD